MSLLPPECSNNTRHIFPIYTHLGPHINSTYGRISAYSHFHSRIGVDYFFEYWRTLVWLSPLLGELQLPKVVVSLLYLEKQDVLSYVCGFLLYVRTKNNEYVNISSRNQ